MRSKTLICACQGLLLAGCGDVQFRDVPISERCADIMRAAIPNAEIEITSKSSAVDLTVDMATLVANAQGIAKRKGVSNSIGMRCVFHNSILTSIQWTAGPER